ncbi:MAG: hypothetical protein AB7R55_10100 [Gemmatimonadales bacterium]
MAIVSVPMAEAVFRKPAPEVVIVVDVEAAAVVKQPNRMETPTATIEEHATPRIVVRDDHADPTTPTEKVPSTPPLDQNHPGPNPVYHHYVPDRSMTLSDMDDSADRTVADPDMGRHLLRGPGSDATDSKQASHHTGGHELCTHGNLL